MRVFVKNMRGEYLMPCSQRKARLLLRDGKAKIVGYMPFTIQMTIATGEAKQECLVGVDTGAKHIGIAVTSGKKVMWKGEVELRQDVSGNIELRKILRRGRRNRKTRYRKARWQNRKKEEGWLPPSIENRVQHTKRWIDKIVDSVPNVRLSIEVGKFDVTKMINPEISGKGYQEGDSKGFYSVRYFVFARDGYTCQCCGKKGGILQTHHIIYRSNGGSNRADNLITVCAECHTAENHKEGGKLWKWQKEKKVGQYKEPTFMSILRRRIFQEYPWARIVYGNETSVRRKELGLEKTHYNDAIAISGIKTIAENDDEWMLIKQFRKKKRSLHEATARKGRKEKNRESKREAKNTPVRKGWYLDDKVRVFGKTGFISGFTGSSMYVKTLDGDYITCPGKEYKGIPMTKVQLIGHNNNWGLESNSSHPLKGMGFLAKII